MGTHLTFMEFWHIAHGAGRRFPSWIHMYSAIARELACYGREPTITTYEDLEALIDSKARARTMWRAYQGALSEWTRYRESIAQSNGADAGAGKP